MACDPEKAIEVILQQPFEMKLRSGRTVTVYPLTLARYAVYEKIRSPFLSKEGGDVESAVATLFVMTCPIEKLKKLRTADQTMEAACEWAEEMGTEDLDELIDTAASALEMAGYVAPGSDDEKDKKKRLMES